MSKFLEALSPKNYSWIGLKSDATKSFILLKI